MPTAISQTRTSPNGCSGELAAGRPCWRPCPPAHRGPAGRPARRSSGARCRRRRGPPGSRGRASRCRSPRGRTARRGSSGPISPMPAISPVAQTLKRRSGPEWLQGSLVAQDVAEDAVDELRRLVGGEVAHQRHRLGDGDGVRARRRRTAPRRRRAAARCGRRPASGRASSPGRTSRAARRSAPGARRRRAPASWCSRWSDPRRRRSPARARRPGSPPRRSDA